MNAGLYGRVGARQQYELYIIYLLPAIIRLGVVLKPAVEGFSTRCLHNDKPIATVEPVLEANQFKFKKGAYRDHQHAYIKVKKTKQESQMAGSYNGEVMQFFLKTT